MGLIYLDACLVIYMVEHDPVFGDRVIDLLSEAPGTRFAVSPLVKAECLVKPMRTGDLLLQRRYEEALGRFVTLPMPEPVFVSGAMLRARFNLRMPDALHLACALHHECDALWTNDDRLAQAGHGFVRNALS